RRRHTRWPRDWSSDVCSSDLAPDEPAVAEQLAPLLTAGQDEQRQQAEGGDDAGAESEAEEKALAAMMLRCFVKADRLERQDGERSEERRVGKECRCGGGREEW